MNKVLHFLKAHRYTLILTILFVLVHLPALGFDNFNTDVWKWKKRIFDFSNGVFYLKPEETVQTYHPGVTLMWAGTVAVKFFNLSKDLINHGQDYGLHEVFYLDFTQKLFVVLGIALGFFAILVAVSKLLGNRATIIIAVLFTVEPFILALTRVIHLEGLTTTYLIAAVLWLYVWSRERKKRDLVISAVFGALAVLTKTSALFILPFAFIYILLLTKHPRDIFKWLLAFVVTAVLVWPALLFRTQYVFEYLYGGVSQVGIEEGHEQFYFNKFVQDPGWTFYFVALAYKSSPFIFVGFIISVFYLAIKPNPYRKFVLYILSFAGLYMLMISIPTKKLDRYMLPVLYSMVLVVGVFLSHLYYTHRKSALIMLAGVLSTIWFAVLVHPVYFTYYNPLFGGLRTGMFVIEPKWLIGTNEIINYFKAVKVRENLEDFKQGENIENLLYKPALDTKLTVAFPEKYYTQIHPFFRLIGGWAVIEDLSGQARYTKFFVYPAWDDYSDKETRFKLEYYGDIEVQGAVAYKVYKRVR